MAKPAKRRPVVRGALWLTAGVASGVAIGIADARLRTRRLVAPAPPARPVPNLEAAPAPPTRRRRTARVALAFVAVLVLAALGAAIAFVATRDERAASPTLTAAVAGTATVRRTATHAPPTAATHATRPARTQATQRTTTSGFVPARVFAWPVVAGADRYEIRFYRGPHLILRERVQRPRFVLPSSLHLSPGRYRWLVLPHVRGRFARAIVDSRFSVVR